MLLLCLEINEEIAIGEGISITVVSVRGRQVRLGIEAPPEVPIRREELAPLAEPTRQEARAIP